jgi:hypothetical protein
MSKFDKLCDTILEDHYGKDYLNIGEIQKVADDCVRSLGLQSQFNGMANGYKDILDSKLQELAAVIVTAFQTAMIHPKYRTDLEAHGYDWLVKIADENSLWQQGQNYGLKSL